jgi:hypothetical protein
MKFFNTVMLASCIALGGVSAAIAQGSTMADPSAPANPAVKSPNDMGVGQLAKGHNSFTKGEARSRIEKAGFTNVGALMLDADGLWQATAMRAGQSVHVALDYKGNVAAQ